MDSPRLSPATTPEVIVAISGVFVLGLIRAKTLKSTPSCAIAQITRGMGKMEPSRLQQTAETCKTNTLVKSPKHRETHQHQQSHHQSSRACVKGQFSTKSIKERRLVYVHRGENLFIQFWSELYLYGVNQCLSFLARLTCVIHLYLNVLKSMEYNIVSASMGKCHSNNVF